jgi:hypothetical protein
MKTTTFHKLHMSTLCNATSLHVVELVGLLLRHLVSLSLFTFSPHPPSTLIYPSNTAKMSAFNFYMVAAESQTPAAPTSENNRGASVPISDSAATNNAAATNVAAATSNSAADKKTKQSKKFYCKLHLHTQSLSSVH